MQALQTLVQDITNQINQFAISDASSLENYRIQFLGTKSNIKAAMASLKDVANEYKKAAGLLLNDLRKLAEEKYNTNKALYETATAGSNKIDATLPGSNYPVGTRHPLSLVRNQIVNIFGRLGFAVAEGPEIEDDWHNFSALNLPEDHPARDMQDTFYISKSPDWLLRTHTSSVQVREMQKGNLPIRIICPGRVYRNETISARAHCFFHQVEGLYIDENVSFAQLKQTLYYFVKEMFGHDVQVRFRPSYFPFTEPSAEMDVSCFICDSKGCNVCKQSGWVEILGCGMVHPQLLENCGIDSNKYTGLAFGMGIERITMLKYQIKDLRLFSENDVRFLKQFTAGI